METLYSQRLCLNKWHNEYLPAFIRLHTHPDVNEWLGGTMSEERAQAYFAMLLAEQDSQPWGLWALCLPNGTLVGAAGLEKIRADMPMSGVEATWRVLPEYWGKGYATEAMQKVLEQSFHHYGFEEILTFTADSNLRSRAVMERLGFRHDPARDFEHPRLPDGHPLRRHVLYWLSSSVYWKTLEKD